MTPYELITTKTEKYHACNAYFNLKVICKSTISSQSKKLTLLYLIKANQSSRRESKWSKLIKVNQSSRRIFYLLFSSLCSALSLSFLLIRLPLIGPALLVLGDGGSVNSKPMNSSRLRFSRFFFSMRRRWTSVSWLTKLTEVPDAPARPVLPIRCI